MAISVLNLLDRQIVNILSESIKKDLDLLDWQVGLVTGLSFALLYSTLAIPVARLAERGDRAYIISASLACWSVFTILCGFATNLWQLILARVGVGMGEAGSLPATNSLISDSVPAEKRASSLAIVHMGLPIGILVGFAFGGLVASTYGWRWALIIAGLPGIAIALLAFLTLREPRRKIAAKNRADLPHVASFRETLAVLAGKRSYVFLCTGLALQMFVFYGFHPFLVAFFSRVHGSELSQIAAGFGLDTMGLLGIILGVSTGAGSGLGVWVGGQLADLAFRRNLKGYCLIPAFAALVAVPFYLAAFLVEDVTLSVGLTVVPAILMGFYVGPIHATAQSVVEPNMRATSTAIMVFAINVIGLGLGPLTIGALSDIFGGVLNMGVAEGVRWALFSSTFILAISGILYFRASRTVCDDIIS